MNWAITSYIWIGHRQTYKSVSRADVVQLHVPTPALNIFRYIRFELSKSSTGMVVSVDTTARKQLIPSKSTSLNMLNKLFLSRQVVVVTETWLDHICERNSTESSKSLLTMQSSLATLPFIHLYIAPRSIQAANNSRIAQTQKEIQYCNLLYLWTT